MLEQLPTGAKPGRCFQFGLELPEDLADFGVQRLRQLSGPVISVDRAKPGHKV